MFKRRLPHAVIFLTVATLYVLGGLRPLERPLSAFRFSLAQHDASGETVLVAIDSLSLQALDTWPWPRAYHAKVAERLLAAGAREVALDVDVSARRDPADDLLLAEMLSRWPGRMMLPAFKQFNPDGDGGTALSHTRPAQIFTQHAEIVSANVRLEPDGKVWRYAMRESWGQDILPSMAAGLAGAAGGPPVFYIDFGIRPSSLPRLSFAEVHSGRFDPAMVAGKRVIIGATAIELGDRIPVPVFGIIPGPTLQALAAESLVQGRALSAASPWLILMGLAALIFLVGPRLAVWNWRHGLGVVAGTSVALFGISVGAQRLAPIMIEIAPFLVALIGCYAYGVIRVIDIQALSIFNQRLEAKHRQAMMSAVVDGSFDGIAITDQDGVTQLANAAALTMLERAEDEIVNAPIHAFLPWTKDIEALYSESQGSASGGVVGPEAVQITRQGGDAATVEIMVSTTTLSLRRGGRKSQTETRRLFLYTFRDISERQRAEEARQHAMEEAMAANRAKSAFLANMGHELRTPLNAIIGFSEMIESQAFGPLGAPQYGEYIGDIRTSGERLLEVINDVLDMSRIEAGELEMREEDFSLAGAFDACTRLVQERADKAKLSLIMEPPNANIMLRADLRLFKQALTNLLDNAIKFTPEGGEVRLTHEIDRARGLIVSVSDTGIGIAPHLLETVTQPFHQADDRLARSYEGTGLGLALVKSILELHGGGLELESALGEGTTAMAHLPGARMSTAPDESAPPTSADRSTDRSAAGAA